MGTPVILCLNSGSSSLKFSAIRFATGVAESLFNGAVEGLGGSSARFWAEKTGSARFEREGLSPGIEAALDAMLGWLSESKLPSPDAVGHRFVHGGPRHFSPERVTPTLLTSLQELVPFAPLHLPAELRAVELLNQRLPGVPQVVCFDTAFHQNLPEVAQRFALPRALFDQGIRRYGFHGISYEYLVQHLGTALGDRAVLAHLGSGASMAAVRNGICVETTMGFGPTGGFMMGTRSGDLDPSILIHLLRANGASVDGLEQLLNRSSGLLGVSGSSADMKVLLAQATESAEAQLAVEMFCYQAAKAVGALTVTLGGLNTLVFAGGVGEHATPVRSAICERLGHLGVELDGRSNDRHEKIISAEGSRVTVHVVETDEDLIIAQHVHRLLS